MMVSRNEYAYTRACDAQIIYYFARSNLFLFFFLLRIGASFNTTHGHISYVKTVRTRTTTFVSYGYGTITVKKKTIFPFRNCSETPPFKIRPLKVKTKL